MMKRYGQDNTGIIPDMGIIEDEKTSPVLTIFIISCIFITIFVFIILFNLLRNKLKLYKIINLTPRDCILQLYNCFVKILALQGLYISAGETPHQYSKKIDKYMFFTSVNFENVTDIFVKCRYSKNEISEKEKSILCDFVRPLISETKMNMGRIKYFLFKCILGKI